MKSSKILLMPNEEIVSIQGLAQPISPLIGEINDLTGQFHGEMNEVIQPVQHLCQEAEDFLQTVDLKKKKNRTKDILKLPKSSLNSQLAHKLIDIGLGWSLIQTIEHFEGLDYQEIVNKLLNAGLGDAVADHFEKFPGLNHVEIVDKLMQLWRGKAVARNLYKFKGVDHEVIAYQLIRSHRGKSLAKYLYNFEGVNHCEIANTLIILGQGNVVAKYLKNFKGLDLEDIKKKLTKQGQEKAIIWQNQIPQSFDHNDIAMQLIKQGNLKSLVHNFWKLKGICFEVASALMENENEVTAIYDKIKYTEFYYSPIDDFMDENGEIVLSARQPGHFILDHLAKFAEDDLTKIILKLLEKHDLSTIIQALEFNKIDLAAVGLKLFEQAQSDESVVEIANIINTTATRNLHTKILADINGNLKSANAEIAVALEQPELESSESWEKLQKVAEIVKQFKIDLADALYPEWARN